VTAEKRDVSAVGAPLAAIGHTDDDRRVAAALVYLWVPRTHRPRSRDEPVLVDEAAQSVGSSEMRAFGHTSGARVVSTCGGARWLRDRCGRRQCSAGGTRGDGFEVTSSEDAHPVEALSPGGAMGWAMPIGRGARTGTRGARQDARQIRTLPARSSSAAADRVLGIERFGGPPGGNTEIAAFPEPHARLGVSLGTGHWRANKGCARSNVSHVEIGALSPRPPQRGNRKEQSHLPAQREMA